LADAAQDQIGGKMNSQKTSMNTSATKIYPIACKNLFRDNLNCFLVSSLSQNQTFNDKANVVIAPTNIAAQIKQISTI
jgi:hypothetical protein